MAARHPHRVPDGRGGYRIDEYYWLRDDTHSEPKVLAHLAAENDYAQRVLAPLQPLERALQAEMTARLEPDEMDIPVWHAGYWYYTRFEPGREYALYARRAGSMQAPEEILIDANLLAQGHDFFEIGDWDVSPDGRRLAYTQDTTGRRQFELVVRDIGQPQTWPERIAGIEPEVVWAGDNRTVLYIEKDPETLLSVRLKAHVVGGAAAEDRLLYEEADDSYYLGLGRSRSERFLLLSCASTNQSQWWYARADDPELRFTPLLAREAGHEYEIEHHGDDFIVRTNWQAPDFRLMRAPIATHADKASWREVYAPGAGGFLEDFEVAAGHVAVNLRIGGQLRIRILAWDGRQLAGPGETGDDLLPPGADAPCVLSLVPTPDYASPRLRFAYSSLVAPEATYEWDAGDGRCAHLKTQKVLGGFDGARYATQLRWAAARDGTRIPVSIAYRRDTPLDASAPIYQYGYGAYGYAIDPGFDDAWISLMDRGFVVAIAHVRGGQELGRAWYDGGRREHKMNSFTDFIDVTRMLVAEGYGSPRRVCAHGASAGGLLVAAAANMAPECYCAVAAHVPFVDVVTTMLDESIPLTTNEFDEWGDPRRPGDYARMLAYSPYDNVRAQPYPAMIVFTGLWDSQVQYFEPAKWVARLRARRTDARPLLLLVDLHAGHGGKSGRLRGYEETAREYAFLLWQAGCLGDAREPGMQAPQA